MDESDHATMIEMRDTELLIRAARLNQREAEPTGRCLNCDEELMPERRWCDAECALDWRKRTHANGFSNV